MSATLHVDSTVVLNLLCGYMWCCLSLPVGYVVLLNGANPPDLVVVYPYAILLGPFVNTLAENKPQVCTSILHSACLWCTSICYHFEYLYKSVAFLKVIINVTCHLGRKPQIYRCCMYDNFNDMLLWTSYQLWKINLQCIRAAHVQLLEQAYLAVPHLKNCNCKHSKMHSVFM